MPLWITQLSLCIWKFWHKLHHRTATINVKSFHKFLSVPHGAFNEYYRDTITRSRNQDSYVSFESMCSIWACT